MPLPFFIITLVLLLLFSSHSKKTKPTSTKLPSFPSHPFFLFYLSSFFLYLFLHFTDSCFFSVSSTSLFFLPYSDPLITHFIYSIMYSCHTHSPAPLSLTPSLSISLSLSPYEESAKISGNIHSNLTTSPWTKVREKDGGQERR